MLKFLTNTIVLSQIQISLQKVVLFCLLSIIIYSCSTQKQLTYLQDIDQPDRQNFYPSVQPEYRLQKQDILYVKFTTLNEEVNSSLNGGTTTNNQSTFQSEGGIYVTGFAINDSGFINLPVIGKVLVLGKTMEETSVAIIKKASQFVNNPTVVVKLLSFRFTVLGEVNTPGTFVNYKNQLSILEAIGKAGDITDYGDRSNILILRSMENGTSTFRINLQKSDVLNSQDFFLVPNDVVIIEPLKRKYFNLNVPTFSFFLSSLVSTISLTLLITTVINPK